MKLIFPELVRYPISHWANQCLEDRILKYWCEPFCIEVVAQEGTLMFDPMWQDQHDAELFFEELRR